MTTTPVRQGQKAVAITEDVEVQQIRSTASGYLLRPYTDWDWRDLRDYVVAQIEKVHGPQPRDAKKEYGIFNRFMSAFDDGLAGLVARYAFEVENGFWNGAPISVNRFCKASDNFFAVPILERIADTDWYPAGT